MAVGQLGTTADAEQTIVNEIASIAPHATAKTTVTNGVIMSTVTVPLTDLAATGLVSAFATIDLHISSQQMAES